MSQEFSVPVVVNVVARAVVTVRADSLESAAKAVADDIQELGWGSKAWEWGDFEPDWQTADNLQVDDILLPNGTIYSP